MLRNTNRLRIYIILYNMTVCFSYTCTQTHTHTHNTANYDMSLSSVVQVLCLIISSFVENCRYFMFSTNGTSNLLSNVCIHLPINTGTFMVSS